MIAQQHTTAGSQLVNVQAYYRAGFFSLKRVWQIQRRRTQFPPLRFYSPVLRKDSRIVTILSYNVWFNSIADVIRHPAIAKLIAETAADVVYLQEVNVSFLSVLKADRGVQRAYARIGADFETLRGSFHGCLMLVRRNTLQVTEAIVTDLPDSKDARKLLYAKVTGIAGTHTADIRDLSIATAHLESPRTVSAESSRGTQMVFVRASSCVRQ
jgi:endonuclease/exonuclease/phosphatase family metal-dependent hydrolase